ncbi:MAG: 3'-5' exonuclease [Elusimicrobium sp.]|jgi:DNA polymerase-3 subunit epsilon|nr:3'-5' exonuclease [Elusimicrobium sp.]
MNLKEQLIKEAKFAFLDTETTGMSPVQGARICEIAVVINGAQTAKEEFAAVLNPGVIIPQEVINIHGITNAMAAAAPRFEHIAPRLVDMLDNAVIVCHNADFDIPFLAYEFSLCGLRIPQSMVLDTLKFSRKHGGFKKNNLGHIVTELGLSSEGWHRAMADAKMTEKVFYHFLAKFIAAGAKTVGDLEDLQLRKI